MYQDEIENSQFKKGTIKFKNESCYTCFQTKMTVSEGMLQYLNIFFSIPNSRRFETAK